MCVSLVVNCGHNTALQSRQYYDLIYPPLLPIFVCGGHSASVCRARDGGDGCSNSAQVLDDGGKELLAGTLVQVEADLIGHQQVVLLHKLLQDVTHSLWVIEKYEALEEGKKKHA